MLTLCHTCGGQRAICRSFFLPPLGFGDRRQVARLGDQHIHPPSHSPALNPFHSCLIIYSGQSALTQDSEGRASLGLSTLSLLSGSTARSRLSDAQTPSDSQSPWDDSLTTCLSTRASLLPHLTTHNTMATLARAAAGYSSCTYQSVSSGAPCPCHLLAHTPWPSPVFHSTYHLVAICIICISVAHTAPLPPPCRRHHLRPALLPSICSSDSACLSPWLAPDTSSHSHERPRL